MPKISVVIPVYNAEMYLRECLDSVVNQTLYDIEIICVNDGSTDNSQHILEEYSNKDSRIKIINQENQGAGAARNKGLETAAGEYISFLDSDDFFDLRMLEKLYDRAMETNADITVCEFYNYNHLNKKTISGCSLRKECTTPYKEIFSYKDYPQAILDTVLPEPWNKLFRTDFLRQCGIKFQNQPYFNNVLFCTLVLAYAKSITSIPDRLVYYRNNVKNSATSNKFKDFSVLQNVLDDVNKECTKLDYYLEIKESVINFNLNFCKYYLNQATKTKFYEPILLKIKDYIKNNDLFNNVTEANTIGELYKFVQFVLNYKEESKKAEFFKSIFNLKNIDIYKQLTILGIKFKFINIKSLKKNIDKRLKDLKACQNETGEYTMALNTNVKDNTILLIEPNDCHGEVIPGYAKYFKELGFNVDIIITPKQKEKQSLYMFENTDINIYVFGINFIKNFLSSQKIEQYKYIVFTSHIMYERINYIIYPTIFQHFPVVENYRDKLFVVEHHFEFADKKLLENRHIIVLAKLPSQTHDVICANPHYFGKISVTSKNPVTTEFIMVGAIEKQRRNCSILINAVNKLIAEGFDNFRVTVIGRGTLDAIPHKLQKYFNILGTVPYDKMYREMEKADFFLPLIDPDNPEHDRYITVGTSGSFQLIYGFQKPCLIAEKFASIHYFDNENSIIYKTNDELSEAMRKAIFMSQQDYMKKQESLKLLADRLYKKSLNNLQKSLKGNSLICH